MSSKKKFVLRVDDEIFQAIEKWASDEFRSINGQIEYLLHQSLQKSGRLGLDMKNRSKSDLKTNELD